MDDEIMKIDIEDIQDLVIQKKFVKINSEKYTDNAFQYIKYLIDKERAILFDEDTHRIYTLGDYYGGDALRENLLYFSKLLSIDIDNEILSEIDASINDDTLAFKGKGALKVNIVKDKYSTVEIEYKLNEAINTNPFHLNPNNEYRFYIDDNGKISIKEYIYPKVIINLEPLDDNENINNNIIKTIHYEIESSVDFNDWTNFNIITTNCRLISHDQTNHNIEISFLKNINGIINIEYSDGVISTSNRYIQYWYKKIIYGIYENDNFVKQGEYKFINNDISTTFIINQSNNVYGYCMCPLNYKLVFIDNYNKIQGAWHKINNMTIQNEEYKVYLTDNSGLGTIEWYIINKNI